MLQTISIKVTGKVQGVFYRQSALEKARVLGVNGTVCNLRDGAVQIIATATAAQLSQLLAWCRQGGRAATAAGAPCMGAPAAIRRRALPRASGAYGKWYILAAFPPAILTFSSSVHSARISPRICCVRGKVDSTWG